MPFRVKALFVFSPLVFLVGYFIWASAAGARKYPTEGFWRQFFFWFWRRDPDEPSGESAASGSARCGSFTVRMNEVADWRPSCRREVVHEGS
jgi:hypothetical protein